jgi:hypothetical protein
MQARRTIGLAVVAATACALVATGAAGPRTVAQRPVFTHPTRIDNPLLPLSRHRRCESRGRVGGVLERSVRTRLDRTEPFTVAGQAIEAVVIEDRAFEGGELVERTLDYYAQSDDGTVWYLGEDVDEYEDGHVAGHGGSWRLGRETRTPGVAMPPHPHVGSRWRFEAVPGVTTERDTAITAFDRVEVANGRVYPDVLRVQEDLSPEGVSEYKWYASGVGEIREVEWDLRGMVELVGCR